MKKLLHTERPGRPLLALDLMEEFRPFLADRLALSLINLRQVQGRGFKTTETGAVEMNDETRKEVLVAFEKPFREPEANRQCPGGSREAGRRGEAVSGDWWSVRSTSCQKWPACKKMRERRPAFSGRRFSEAL